MVEQKCQSCKKGYNGTNGNGYQPCGCNKPKNNAKPPKNPLFEGWDWKSMLEGWDD